MFSYIIGIAASTLSPEALLSNKSLTFLDLTNNSIGNDGASELAKVLQRSQTITEMKLWGNPISKSGAEALSQAFRAHPIHAAYLREANAAELEQALNPTLHVASNVQPLQRRPP